MSRIHYLQDRVKISRRLATLNRGIVDSDPNNRQEVTDWIPARLRIPAGDEVQPTEVKVDLPVTYELVLLGEDENGRQICPKQHDEFIIRYRRDSELVETSSRLRITGTIEEIRKRSKLFTYVIPVVMDTEM